MSFPILCFHFSDQIALNHKTIVCPMIDVIDHNHFGYEAQAGDAMRGAFDWEMYYKRIPIPPELQRADPSDPFEWVAAEGGAAGARAGNSFQARVGLGPMRTIISNVMDENRWQQYPHLGGKSGLQVVANYKLHWVRGSCLAELREAAECVDVRIRKRQSSLKMQSPQLFSLRRSLPLLSSLFSFAFSLKNHLN